MQKHNKTLRIVSILIIMMIWLWTTAIVSVASEIDTNTDTLIPTENQYFEMRATEIKEIEGKNRQVIFELWGNNIEFKRI